MERGALSESNGQRVFRLAYASRAGTDMNRGAVVNLTANAAENNRRNHVSGVLFSGNGIFLQWLEGPGEDVCALMSRIQSDPRHRDVTVLSAGWLSGRRYPRWPMQLAGHRLPPDSVTQAGTCSRSSPCDSAQAMAAFDVMAEAYRRQEDQSDVAAPLHADFAQRLMLSTPDRPLPCLPKSALADLRVRAQFVDDVCAAFMSGWQDDRWSSVEIAIGLLHLNCLWQGAGRIPEPVRARQRVAVAVAPGSGEILGSIVTADLLRASEVSVRMVIEPDANAAIDALSGPALEAVIVAGSRVGWGCEDSRAEAFADTLRERLTGVPIHVGGRSFGPLCDWPERLAFRRHEAAALSAKDVDWLALTMLAAFPSAWAAARPHHPDFQRPVLN